MFLLFSLSLFLSVWLSSVWQKRFIKVALLMPSLPQVWHSVKSERAKRRQITHFETYTFGLWIIIISSATRQQQHGKVFFFVAREWNHMSWKTPTENTVRGACHDGINEETEKHIFRFVVTAACAIRLRNNHRPDSSMGCPHTYMCVRHAVAAVIPTYILIRHIFFWSYEHRQHITNKIESESRCAGGGEWGV